MDGAQITAVLLPRRHLVRACAGLIPDVGDTASRS